MNKSQIALTALASFAGMASAQSSVTLFGVIDATLARGYGTVSDRTQLANSGYNSSRLGFRGTEDLGGGMSASFWLEAGVNTDNGTGAATNVNNQTTGGVGGGQGLTFNRRSTISLAGNWGELRLGRDYTPQFWNLVVFDPFGTLGVGITQTISSIATIPTAARASNSAGYLLPGNLGGFYGHVIYYMGENSSGSSTSKDGNGYGVRVGFAKGPIDVAVAVSRTTYFAGDFHQNNIGAQYDFGAAKLMGQYTRDKNGSANGEGALIGGLIPIGAGMIRLSYSRYQADTAGSPTSKKWALGYVHNLSKRTALYGTYARVGNTGGAAQALNGAVTGPNGSSSGYDFGVRHSF